MPKVNILPTKKSMQKNLSIQKAQARSMAFKNNALNQFHRTTDNSISVHEYHTDDQEEAAQHYIQSNNEFTEQENEEEDDLVL